MERLLINDVGLHPIIREAALADPELFAQLDYLFAYEFPLINAYMFFTKDRKTYVFGDNTQECLGFKIQKKGAKVLRTIAKPRELDILRNKKITSVVYRRHVIVLTEDHEMYGWGRNDYGALGTTKGRDFSIRPQLLIENIDKVATYEHTIVLDRDGVVFTFGLNVDRQVDPSNDDDVIFFPFTCTIPEPCREIGCSSKVSVVMTVSNKLYMWGTAKGETINVCQTLNVGPIKKLIVLEYKSYDTWVLTLNEAGQINFHHYDSETKKIETNLITGQAPASDIIGSDESSFAVVETNNQVSIYKNVDDKEHPFSYKIYKTNLTSPVDAMRLYRVRIKPTVLYKLSNNARDLNVIENLRTFNNPQDYDLVINWECDLSQPSFKLKKEILIQHCPYFDQILTNNQETQELTWPGNEEKPPRHLIENKPYEYLDRHYPSFQAMYGYLRCLYTGQITVGHQHWNEIKRIAEYFNDEKVANMIEKRIEEHSSQQQQQQQESQQESTNISGGTTRPSKFKKQKTSTNNDSLLPEK